MEAKVQNTESYLTSRSNLPPQGGAVQPASLKKGSRASRLRRLILYHLFARSNNVSYDGL